MTISRRSFLIGAASATAVAAVNASEAFGQSGRDCIIDESQLPAHLRGRGLQFECVDERDVPANVRTRPETQDANNRYGHPAPRRVPYTGTEPVNTLLISNSNHRLYVIHGDGTATEVVIAVGFGEEKIAGGTEFLISHARTNPSWTPPASMLAPGQASFTIPGHPQNNPLGAGALYLVTPDGRATLYRIHGTNAPRELGQDVSAGCIRTHNQDIRWLMGVLPTINTHGRAGAARVKVFDGPVPGISQRPRAALAAPVLSHG